MSRLKLPGWVLPNLLTMWAGNRGTYHEIWSREREGYKRVVLIPPELTFTRPVTVLAVWYQMTGASEHTDIFRCSWNVIDGGNPYHNYGLRLDFVSTTLPNVGLGWTDDGVNFRTMSRDALKENAVMGAMGTWTNSENRIRVWQNGVYEGTSSTGTNLTSSPMNAVPGFNPQTSPGSRTNLLFAAAWNRELTQAEGDAVMRSWRRWVSRPFASFYDLSAVETPAADTEPWYLSASPTDGWLSIQPLSDPGTGDVELTTGWDLGDLPADYYCPMRIGAIQESRYFTRDAQPSGPPGQRAYYNVLNKLAMPGPQFDGFARTTIYPRPFGISDDRTILAFLYPNAGQPSDGSYGKVWLRYGTYFENEVVLQGATDDLINLRSVSADLGILVTYSSLPTSNQGRLKIYSGTLWGDLLTLTEPTGFGGPGNSRYFGATAAITRDGTRIAAQARVPATLRGGVWILSGTDYGTSAILTPSDAADNDNFGTGGAIAWSPDGTKLLVGSPNYAGGGTNRGRVHVFHGTGGLPGGFGTETVLTLSDAADQDAWGLSVHWSGNDAIVGAIYTRNNADGSLAGKLYRFSGASFGTEESWTAPLNGRAGAPASGFQYFGWQTYEPQDDPTAFLLASMYRYGNVWKEDGGAFYLGGPDGDTLTYLPPPTHSQGRGGVETGGWYRVAMLSADGTRFFWYASGTIEPTMFDCELVPYKDGWRTPQPWTEEIPAGTWSIPIPLKATANRAGAGLKAVIRIWKSATGDAPWTEITSGPQEGTTVTNLDGTVQESVVSVSLSAVSLADEYLLIQVAAKTT